MKTQTIEIIDKETQEQTEVFAQFSEQLATLLVQKKVLSSVGSRLADRIKTSIINHAGLKTIRSKEGIWQGLGKGIRYKPLWQGIEGNSVLIEFAPGAVLPVHKHLYVEEGIVLSGSLQHDDEVLQQYDYHISPAGSQHGHIRSVDGALAFLRGSSIGNTLAMTKEVLGGVMPGSKKASESNCLDSGVWVELQPGVFTKQLWTDGKHTSWYYRLEPNTKLAGHDHPLDEECMMLSGDVFLGDILLQTGDYQIALAGSKHLEITTDTGALLYVRGKA